MLKAKDYSEEELERKKEEAERKARRGEIEKYYLSLIDKRAYKIIEIGNISKIILS